MPLTHSRTRIHACTHANASRRCPRASDLVLATLTLAVVADACISDSAVAPDTPIDTLDAALSEVTMPALDYAVGDVQRRGDRHTADRAVALSVRRRRRPPSSATRSPAADSPSISTTHSSTPPAAGSGVRHEHTAGLVVNSAVAGTATGYVGGNAVTLTVDAQQELTLSGLGTAQHKINGTSLTLTTLTRSDGAEPPVTSTITTRVVDLVIPVVPRRADAVAHVGNDRADGRRRISATSSRSTPRRPRRSPRWSFTETAS